MLIFADFRDRTVIKGTITGSNIREFYQSDNHVTFKMISFRGSAATSYSDENISTEVPQTAISISGSLYWASTNSTGQTYGGVYIQSNQSGAGNGFSLRFTNIQAYRSSARLVINGNYANVFLTTPQQVTVKSINATLANWYVSDYMYGGII